MRFARRRFGRYDIIDFVAVLFGYAISSERTLEAFYLDGPLRGSYAALFTPSSTGAATTAERGVSFAPVFAHQIWDELFNKLVAHHVGDTRTGRTSNGWP